MTSCERIHEFLYGIENGGNAQEYVSGLAKLIGKIPDFFTCGSRDVQHDSVRSHRFPHGDAMSVVFQYGYLNLTVFLSCGWEENGNGWDWYVEESILCGLQSVSKKKTVVADAQEAVDIAGSRFGRKVAEGLAAEIERRAKGAIKIAIPA